MKILVSILLGLLAIGAVAQGNDDLTMNNNRFVKFLASGNVDDGVKIGRFSGNALRVSYQGNVIAFDALDNRAIIFNNAGNQTKIQLHPAGKSFIKGGDFGVGLSNPDAKFHVLSDAVDINSTDEKAANLIIEASSGTRSMNEGATLGFVIPANTNGGNAWQQGRIMVTPNNESNANASGRMLLQTRYYNSGSWEWQNNLTLTAGGSVGVDVINPTEKLEVNGTIRSKEIKVEAAPWPDYVSLRGTGFLIWELQRTS
ncbi:hypothetical protein [Marinoscillum luteum]|uniref:Uncharacterized protein n=1 Tax=Marinoscillum luteum TaxID=861051 RepID=A0ABW7NEN8_9BACT